MSAIGFVGLGTMGSRVAGRLLDAGHELYGTNRTKAKAEPLIERGLQWRETPSQVAAAADVVFSMVTDDAALRAITSGLDGILAGLASASPSRPSRSARVCCSPSAAGSPRGLPPKP